MFTFTIETIEGTFSTAKWRQEQRDRERAQVKAEALLCDCWRGSGPICAKCKLRQHSKQADAEDRD